jgi:hypothetical protein
MTRRSAWEGPDAIRFSDQDHSDREIGDQGLLFVPYTARQGSRTCEQPPRYAPVYPARGAAAAFDTPRADRCPCCSVPVAPGSSSNSRGPRPARSSPPGGTCRWARSAATLAVLRAAGVVGRSRVGRGVFYRLTERGESLLALNEG